MKSGKQVRVIIAVVGLVLFSCCAITWLAALDPGDVPTPVPVFVMLGIATIVVMIVALVGLLGFEKPRRMVTVYGEKALSSKTVQAIAYSFVALLGMYVLFYLPGALFEKREWNPLDTVAVAICGVSIALVWVGYAVRFVLPLVDGMIDE